MSQSYERLKAKLMELFQLDQPELDFGFYRIMHAKSAEITKFLEEDLLPQVRAAFAEYSTADRAEIEKELAKAIEQATALGVDPESAQKVKELRAKLAAEAVDLEALENEVYDHLYSFFRRYYSEGDFLSRRVYKPGVYAIPYEGEEVKLHWANADQYYIKTAEYLRDYTFRLRPHDENNPMRVHFRLVDAAEGEHGNVKEAAGKERRFKLAPEAPLRIENGELVVRFTYQPDPAKQKDLNADAERTILGMKDVPPELAEWIRVLGANHVRTDGTVSESTRLRVHLDRYTARNTFDYFIHKDLGGFLRRELDFYIKNEVMHLDDIENETAPRVEQYLSKIKVIRKIAGKIIDFLAQLEDFQKKLWLKKKFVVETSYCIRLGIIPEEFYPEIAANDAQREEWVRLCAIDEIGGDLVTPGYSEPLAVEFLKAQPTLSVDTRHFDERFTMRLLAAIANLDEQICGLLVHSENSQALLLLQHRYRNTVKCAYLDPPYNTGQDGFAYRDRYQHSSWLSLVAGRLAASVRLLKSDGIILVSVDDIEVHRLRMLSDELLGDQALISQLVWKSRQFLDSRAVTRVSNDHEYVVALARSPAGRFRGGKKDLSKYRNPDNDPRGPWMSRSLLGLATRQQRPNLHYEIVDPSRGNRYSCPEHTGWRYSLDRMHALIADGRILFPKNPNGRPREKVFLAELKAEFTGFSSVISNVYTADGSHEIRDLFGSLKTQFPKPSRLVAQLVEQAALAKDTIIDYFAGSGTTGHAVINLKEALQNLACGMALKLSAE